MRNAHPEHMELIARANESVAEASAFAQKDPLRPIYHLMTAARWIGDPNGPIFYNGEYHMFFQHNPHGNTGEQCSWGHAKSKDLVHWEHQPVALTNNPAGYDSRHVASGCCVIHEGVPTIIYTGMHPQVQCIAQSYDNMTTWTKYSGNPVVAERPRDDLTGFRDLFAWREGDAWYIVVGAGIKGQGGTALLYRSKDLVEWEYLQPLCVGFGEMWECPNFFPLGNKHVLVVSPHDHVKYSIGTYEDYKFTPGPWHKLDLGGRRNFYAPNSLEDHKERRIMWGWIRGGGTEGYPWDGLLTLPRVLTLRPDGRLGMEPPPELKALRGKGCHFGDITITSATSDIFRAIKGDSLEIIAEFEPGDAKTFGIEVRCSPDGEERTPVGYDTVRKQLVSGDKADEFELPADEKTLKLQLFLDKSVTEAYVNGRACFTNRLYPKRSDSLGINIFARGGSVRVKSVDIWEMNTIW